MTLAEGIDRLQRETAGCRALVFGDLETRTVLRSAAVACLRQEDHDALLAEAATLLGTAGARLLRQVDGGPAVFAVRFGASETHLFRVVAEDGAEVLCARLDAMADAAAFDAALAQLLDAHG